MSQVLNAPVLGQAQADQIRSYQGNIKRNVIDLAKLAFDIHSQHIGKNGRYSADFEKWWESHNIESLFGSKSNWSRWHAAGGAIAKVEARFSQHFAQMPMSVDALYQVAQLTDEELVLCLQDTYSRTSLTQPQHEWSRPKKPKPLITSSVAASKLRAWRENWRNPQPKQKADPRRVVLATIKIHGSFFNFDKAAAHTGKLDKETVRSLNEKLRKALGGNEQLVLIESHAEELCSKFDAREEKAIERAKKVKAKNLKKKSSMAKTG